MSPNTYPNGEWVWHEQSQNYYMQKWDGVQWTTIWANQSTTPRRDSVAEIPASVPAAPEPGTEAGQELALESVPGDLAAAADAILGKPEHGSYEYLDPSYIIQPQARRFFTQGRMFSILFTEPMGSTTVNKQVDNVTTVMYGEQVYSTIRRFIVVKEAKGFCYACPISTYGGRGTTKPGLDPSKHAIVYSTNLEPRLVPGEMQLQMAPIPVDPIEGSGTLASASRINFAIHQPIQHNVKVKNLGMVHMSYIPTLIQYARAGLGW